MKEWSERVKVTETGHVVLDSAHIGTWLIPFLKQVEREAYLKGAEKGLDIANKAKELVELNKQLLSELKGGTE